MVPPPPGGGGSCEEVDPPQAGGSFDWCEEVKTRRGAGLSIGAAPARGRRIVRRGWPAGVRRAF